MTGWILIALVTGTVVWKAGWIVEKVANVLTMRQLMRQKKAAEAAQAKEIAEQARKHRGEQLRIAYALRRIPVDQDIKGMTRDIERGLPV